MKCVFYGEHSGDHNHQDFPKSTAIQMGGVLQYKWEARPAIQMGGVLTVFPFPQSVGAPKVFCNTNWRRYCNTNLGHTPSTAGTFRKKFWKNSGKTPETLSERFLEFPSRVRLGCPKPYNSRHLRLPERFQNFLPPSTAGDASFFRIGSGEGLSEPVMEFPAVLGVFLKIGGVLRYFLEKYWWLGLLTFF